MLAAEHVEIDAMFERLLHGRLDAARRHALVHELCMTLRIHLLLEEEIFYPAVKRAVGPLAHMDRSHAQHDAAKPLLAQLMAMRPGDPQGDATIARLADYVRTHQAEEKNELFPRVRASGLSMRGLGEQMRARRRALLSATVVFGEVLTTSL